LQKRVTGLFFFHLRGREDEEEERSLHETKKESQKRGPSEQNQITKRNLNQGYATKIEASSTGCLSRFDF
jgi:hypothetical protein